MWRHHNSWTNLGLMIPPSDIGLWALEHQITLILLANTIAAYSKWLSLYLLQTARTGSVNHNTSRSLWRVSVTLFLGCQTWTPLVVAAGQYVFKMERCAVEGRGCAFDLPYRVYLNACEGQRKAYDAGNERWGSWWREEGRYCFMRLRFGLTFASCVQAGG